MGSIRDQPNPLCRTSITVSDVSGFASASVIFRILPNCYIAFRTSDGCSSSFEPRFSGPPVALRVALSARANCRRLTTGRWPFRAWLCHRVCELGKDWVPFKITAPALTPGKVGSAAEQAVAPAPSEKPVVRARTASRTQGMKRHALRRSQARMRVASRCRSFPPPMLFWMNWRMTVSEQSRGASRAGTRSGRFW
jgi:hypothetical protein